MPDCYTAGKVALLMFASFAIGFASQLLRDWFYGFKRVIDESEPTDAQKLEAYEKQME